MRLSTVLWLSSLAEAFVVPTPASPSLGETSAVSSTSPCVCTQYSQIAAAVENCTDIVLKDIRAPTNSTIDLTKLMQGSKVTFAGTTTFDFTNRSSFDPIKISGKGIIVEGGPGHVLDGNGSIYWDGLGSNGGVPKPNHFIVLSKMTDGSTVRGLNIRNWPVHCFSITNCSDLTISNILLDNTSGFRPNAVSGNLSAAHNSDGFGISSCNRTVITNSTVVNQDDCVAVTSGSDIEVSYMSCAGGHGLSVGSVGGKFNNVVSNVIFRDSIIVRSENGARIKTNFNTTGSITNVIYQNIMLEDIERYGIDLQQDYLNGGPTGIPSDGVNVTNIIFRNVVGTMAATGKSQSYHVLCGVGSCKNVVFENSNITTGAVKSSCNYPEPQCPSA